MGERGVGGWVLVEIGIHKVSENDVMACINLCAQRNIYTQRYRHCFPRQREYSEFVVALDATGHLISMNVLSSE